jgi:hypothetical protein
MNAACKQSRLETTAGLNDHDTVREPAIFQIQNVLPVSASSDRHGYEDQRRRFGLADSAENAPGRFFSRPAQPKALYH